MLNHKRKLANPFPWWTDDKGEPRPPGGNVQAIIVGGANIQTNFLTGKFPDSMELISAFTKKLVVERTFVPIGVSVNCQVRLREQERQQYQLSGPLLEFWGATGREFPAGGAANVSWVMTQNYGVKPVLLVASRGPGKQGERLLAGLRKEGLCHAFLESPGTNHTLAAIKAGSGQTLMFCEKNKYQVPAHTGEFLGKVSPRLLAFASARPDDLDLMDQTLAVFGERERVVRAVMPHADMLSAEKKNEGNLAKFRGMLGRFNFAQVNLSEGALLAGQPVPSKPKTEAEARDLGYGFAAKIMGTGVGMVIVTLSAFGAVIGFHSGKSLVLHHQPGFKSKSVDMTGAGDVHFATFLSYFYLLGNGKVEARRLRALYQSSWAAARAIAHEGPTNGVPNADRMKRFLNTGK